MSGADKRQGETRGKRIRLYDGSTTVRATEVRYGYLNTHSEAGSGERFVLAPHLVSWITIWVNGFGNPTTMFHMVNGDTILCVDDYGAMNGMGSVGYTSVQRRKDL